MRNHKYYCKQSRQSKNNRKDNRKDNQKYNQKYNIMKWRTTKSKKVAVDATVHIRITFEKQLRFVYTIAL